jgi:hypothetical protein
VIKEKSISRIILLGTILFFNFSYLNADEIKTIQAEEIWTIEKGGSYPCLSPDGSMVAWVEESKVYIAKVGTKEVIEIGQTKEFLGWLPESNEYLMTAEGFLSVKTKKLFKTIKNAPNIIIKRASLSIPINVSLSKIEKIYPLWVIQNGEIKKVYSTEEPYNFVLFGDTSKIKRIIIFQNGFPIYVNNESKDNLIFDFFASPAQDKYVLRFAYGAIVILPKEYRTYTLPTGSYLSWSPDGQKLIFAVLEDDGHKLTSGKLFICNWDGSEVRQIVFDTPRIRTRPSFGPQNLITYSIEEDGNIGIGVAKLIDQKKEKTKQR